MASKQTYECYVCKRNGFENVRVFLDGKTEDGKTIYKNENMSPHVHRQEQHQHQHQQQSQSKSTTIVTQQTKEDQVLNLLGDLTIKMNHVIKLLDEKGKETSH